MHNFFSICKHHYRYLDLSYDMFYITSIIGYYVVQQISKILHDPLRCWNIDVVNGILNDSFQLSKGFGVIFAHIFFNVAAQNESHVFRAGESGNEAGPFPVASKYPQGRMQSSKCLSRTSSTFMVPWSRTKSCMKHIFSKLGSS